MPASALQNHPYRILPGQIVDANALPTDDMSLFPMTKDEGKELMKSMSKEIDELQTQIYAEGKHRLLVIFQAMDTGGKDGTVKSVLSGVNPTGVEIMSFKAPSEEERDHDFL